MAENSRVWGRGGVRNLKGSLGLGRGAAWKKETLGFRLMYRGMMDAASVNR
ncbi:hypothetical protein COLO4_06171 [Corchorus olitorius]|uniref:Uncharacterized protein n=1 Tax=Corchorus olitorius TaxID=93759 RepID=A0A1R3KNQ1_9ROSI|nr:hypothetical protein COLO4_06171 [Corchorus olitorius]